MKPKSRPSRPRRGSVLVTVMIISLSLSVLIAGLLNYSVTERRINVRHALRLEARNAAEAVVEYGFAQLRYKFDNRSTVDVEALKPGTADALTLPSGDLFSPHVDPASFELIGGTIPPMTSQYIDPHDPANQFDILKGKWVLARDINIYGKATVSIPAAGPPITAYVGQILSVRDAPLFAHAIFYNLDLEIFPGPEMNIIGPVHTNGDLYIASQGGNSLNFKGLVSVTGDVYHAWKNGVRGNNNSETLGESPVTFINRDGTSLNMKASGVWKDSTMGTGGLSPDFRSYASNTWNGNLQTEAHGVQNYQPVAFPEYVPDDPDTEAYDPVNSGHALIERPIPVGGAGYSAEKEAQKISSKAGLYISMDSSGLITAKKKDGTEVTLPSSLVTYTPGKLYDRRRGVHVGIADFDVGKLKQLIENPVATAGMHIDNFNPDTDWNGIVYFDFTSGSANLGNTGVRLYNGRVGVSGQGIPSHGTEKGFTFATNNDLYVKGDFNADGAMDSSSSTTAEAGEVPCALYGDAVTLLSNSWNDGVSFITNKPGASSTEVSAAIVTGLVPSDAHDNNTSSGGAHNLPRFLENWGGKNLYIRGSLVALYESQADLSTWSCDYYSPPNRTWGFNSLFAAGTYPPGTPLLRTYRRIDFRTLSKAEYDAAIANLPW